MMDSLPRFVVADPTGNITVLVTDPVDISRQASVAAELFSAVPRCEQVGYVSLLPDSHQVSIRMSGGEFCGNATLSAAAFACREYGLDSGSISVLFDGISSPLTVAVQKTETGTYSGRVQMPLPESCSSGTFLLGGREYFLPVVRFPGIIHILLSEPVAEADAEIAVRLWCHQLDVPALGLMQIRDDALTPLVYVRDVDSLYWEKSCASGTCAAAWAFSRGEEGPVLFSYREPGGILSAEADKVSLSLLGTVSFLD